MYYWHGLGCRWAFPCAWSLEWIYGRPEKRRTYTCTSGPQQRREKEALETDLVCRAEPRGCPVNAQPRANDRLSRQHAGRHEKQQPGAGKLFWHTNAQQKSKKKSEKKRKRKRRGQRGQSSVPRCGPAPEGFAVAVFHLAVAFSHKKNLCPGNLGSRWDNIICSGQARSELAHQLGSLPYLAVVLADFLPGSYPCPAPVAYVVFCSSLAAPTTYRSSEPWTHCATTAQERHVVKGMTARDTGRGVWDAPISLPTRPWTHTAVLSFYSFLLFSCLCLIVSSLTGPSVWKCSYPFQAYLYKLYVDIFRTRILHTGQSGAHVIRLDIYMLFSQQ